MKKETIGAEETYPAPETIILDSAEEDTAKTAGETADAEPSVTVEAKPGKKARTGEILGLRGRNRKVFRMNDGMEQAVFYPEDVHVFDEDTNLFDDVDNTLAEEEDGRHFVNGRNHFTARFSREEENDELFSIERGMHRVTVSAKKNSMQRNHGVKPEIKKRKGKGTGRAKSLRFAGVHNGADYEYSVTGNGVKEDIVVRERTDVYRYPFIIRQENVTAEFNDVKKRIAFISHETGEEVFFIPAPYMTDDNGVISTAVSYEVKHTANGDMLLNVVADSGWMNAEERAFPVVIDPQVKVSAPSAMTTYSWNNGSLYTSTGHTVGTTNNGDGTCNAKRMYIKLNVPSLPRNPRIKKAEIRVCQAAGTSAAADFPKLGLYRVTNGIVTGTCTPIHESNLIDLAKMREGHCEEGEIVSYTFDVTNLVDQINKGETGSGNLVLKMIDETARYDSSITLYGSSHSAKLGPQLIVTYESGYGVNTFYRTHTHELGRFGQGSIDLQCGNLMFESEDLAWGGNRMPVTLRHLYNSALSAHQYTGNSAVDLPAADFSAMKVGNGFKLNLMQSMLPATFLHEDVECSGRVYINENGEAIYFKESREQKRYPGSPQCYHLYEDVISGDMLFDPEELTLKQGTDTYQFDAAGRLIKITDEAGNHMDITYTSNRITSVTDGAGRDFWFAYSGDFLASITAPDETKILYTYSGNLLSTVTYPDGRKVSITYTGDKPAAVTLLDASGNSVYKAAYTFSGDRLTGVAEYGVEDGAFVLGNQSSYSYSAASGRTIVQTTEQKDADEGETANHVIKTVYTFDDDGNIVSEYVYTEDTGNDGVSGGGSGIHPYAGDGGAGVVSNINNLLTGHNFETLDAWPSMSGNLDDFAVRDYPYEAYTKFGKNVLRMKSNQETCVNNGVYQTTNSLPAGQYTFSAYLRVITKFSGTNAGAFIRVVNASGTVLGVSERLSKKDGEYTRLIVPFELASAQSVQVQILVNGAGTVHADAAQLEDNPYANAYNMLENGNFESDAAWQNGSVLSFSTDTRFNMSRSLTMNGAVEEKRCVYQNVKVKSSRSTRETFTLSGWAKGYGLPDHERDGIDTPTFRLRAVITYNDVTDKACEPEEFTADFSPCTEGWQFASVQFSKSKYRTVQDIGVYCEYDHNSGAVYFDDIQLVRGSIETGLAASDFVVESTGVSDDEVQENNDTAPVFEEAKDKFGNVITETTFTDGEFGTIYRAFGFTPDCNCAENAGNDLVSETDARGNTTAYEVNADTSRTEEVTDRCGNKTAYEYDASGRTTKITSKKADGTAVANVSYTYDAFDNMTEIARGDGMKYALAYNAFHGLESIGIVDKDEKLVKYTYKNGNGRLKQMTYANGHTMKAVYNSTGQMTAEKWYETEAQAASSTAVPIAHYKYVYDGQGNIVRSIDLTNKKCYHYDYEEGRIIRAAEADVVLSGEIITAKTVVNTIKYYYDAEGQMTRKVITPEGGAEQTIYYETNDDTVVKFSAGDRTVTSHSRTDSFGRKVFDELQLGTGCVSRQFVYHTGEETDEHKSNAKVKSSATTQIVSQIILTGGRTISYEYDEEERISKVTDSVEGTTEYTYDALGQLLTETVNGQVINTMEYDHYGNITKKNGEVYTYGNGTWKDLLTSYNGQAIEYDAQGNPTTYLGNTLTWEKGRQLKKFVKSDGTVISYTYNANGIRTSKTVDGVKHTYTLDGTKILREAWGSNNLVPLYDNGDSVCGILYNDAPYYFIKNLQGDVIAIVNQNAETVARYSYDAWGVPAITQDTSGCQIAAVNPYRYRGYCFDAETGLYYVSSRYYDPEIGRWLNCDMPEMIGLSIVTGCIKNTNLSIYCLNNPTNDRDIVGCISADQIAKTFSINLLFAMFAAVLYASYSKGLVAVGAYATKIATPIVVKVFWWKPWLIAALIVAVVAIVVAGVAILYASRQGEINKARSKIPNKLMKDGKVDLSKFTNPNGPKMPKGGRGILGPLGWYILKDIDQHRGTVWKLFNKIGERIASLLADGTIMGK